jgi:hypothetical protein
MFIFNQIAKQESYYSIKETVNKRKGNEIKELSIIGIYLLGIGNVRLI